MLRLITPAIAVILLAIPARVQADQQTVDALIGQLRPRSSSTPIVQRGLPKPGGPVNQQQLGAPLSLPHAARSAGQSQGIATPATTALAAVVTTGAAQTGGDSADRPSADMNILFATGSADLTPAAAEQLRSLGLALTHASMGQSRFLIEGHTDTVGESAMNQGLSERRAATVANFLKQTFELAGNRLSTRGVGESQPLVPTADDVPEPRNRRVHIVNLDG